MAEPGTGTIYTHIDCPHCNGVFEREGDVRGETHACDECDEDVEVE